MIKLDEIFVGRDYEIVYNLGFSDIKRRGSLLEIREERRIILKKGGSIREKVEIKDKKKDIIKVVIVEKEEISKSYLYIKDSKNKDMYKLEVKSIKDIKEVGE